MLGTYALSSGYYDAYYLKALKVRTLIKQDFDRAFGQVDVLIAPGAPTTAFKIGEKVEDPLAMYLVDVYHSQQPGGSSCAIGALRFCRRIAGRHADHRAASVRGHLVAGSLHV